jgi:hypothetical protein
MGLAALLVLTGAMAMAQNNTFTCSSDDGQLHSCRVNTNAPIQFVRQRSDAQCIAGETYGIDRGGVWVTNGCRADFVVGNQNAYDQGTYNNNRDRDNDGDADDQNGTEHHHHRRDRDYNGTYNQNGTYNNGTYNNNDPYNNGTYNRQGTYDNRGYNNNRGYVNSGQPIHYYGTYKNGRTTCSANDGNAQTYCSTNGALSDATIIRQNGNCQRGQNWDINPDGLWVAGGCSAEFQIQR